MFFTLEWVRGLTPVCCCTTVLRFPNGKVSRWTDCPVHGKVKSSKFSIKIKQEDLKD